MCGARPHRNRARNAAGGVKEERWAEAGYQRMVARAGVAAKFTFLVHSHMLRHACGFKLANDGHDTRAIQAYLGHRSIMSTVRYTALTPNRFKNFWKD
jgi:site-specific recombinase XerD